MQFLLAKLISKSERRITQTVKNNRKPLLKNSFPRLLLFDSPYIIGTKVHELYKS